MRPSGTSRHGEVAQEEADMETIVERVAGLDVHRDTVVACVRVPGTRRRAAREQHVGEFATTTAGLLALRDWLCAFEVTRVGMEATGTYWKPVYSALEDVCECWVLNARHMRNVPGRKTDIADAVWICQLTEHGLVRPSFVPPPVIRDLRMLTRYRKAQIEERTREAQRLDKVLQDAGIKLSSVASDVRGVSAQAMLRAMVAGERDPEVLAALAKGTLRRKIPELQAALEGRFRPLHAMLVGQILAKLDYLEESIGRISDQIEAVIGPFADEVDLLVTIPGVDRRMAEALIAEIGVDMDRFGSAGRLASWAGVCPGQHESAGRQRHGASRPGSKWLRMHLTQAAKAASRTKGTYLSAQYARIRGRRGGARATIAVAHSILVAVFHILDRQEHYRDLGADYFIRRHSPERHARKLVAQLEAIGFDVQIQERAAA
jgi:transposase